MQLECVGSIPMSRLLLQVFGQVDDRDGLKGALLDTDATSNAELFRDVSYFGVGVHFDAQLADLDNGTALLALLSTFLGLALVFADNGNARRGLFAAAFAILLWCHARKISRAQEREKLAGIAANMHICIILALS